MHTAVGANAAVRRFLHPSYPPIFAPCAEVRVWSKHAQQETTADLPFWLPQELLKAICARSAVEALLSASGLCAETEANSPWTTCVR